VKEFIYVSKEAAQFLVDCKVQTIGVDYLSVGGFFKDGAETHHILLGANVWIIEGLNLERIQPGSYELVCLPIKLVNADGAPARVVLRPV
jgi:arylformamidase